jgi:hypothetical protein
MSCARCLRFGLLTQLLWKAISYNSTPPDAMAIDSRPVGSARGRMRIALVAGAAATAPFLAPGVTAILIRIAWHLLPATRRPGSEHDRPS